jgi:putative nicotinate phosphoribosyltransferase
MSNRVKVAFDTALQTDRYEVTMLDAALASGIAARRAVFEVFARALPAGRRYGVVAGTDSVLDAIATFRFTPDHIDYLQTLQLSPAALAWIAGYRFTGNVWGYDEGECYFPGSPVLTVEATFAEAVLLETVILSIYNHDAAVAAAASRMVSAGAGRRLIEMGSRRTHPDAAVAAARAAGIAGFDATSNLLAGARYGLETAGTAAHAFTLAHLDEATAFEAQIGAQGVGTTLLVDTWDIPNGLRTAVEVARRFGVSGPGGVRIDSGDLVAETIEARVLLDELGATSTRIVVSGDLDEFRIDALLRAGAPIDVFGVGTSLVTGSGHPAAGMTYKLVSIEDSNGVMQPVAKKSAGKAGVGGRKWAYRGVHRVDDLLGGAAREAPFEVLLLSDAQPGEAEVVNVLREHVVSVRAVQHQLVANGEIIRRRTTSEAADWHRHVRSELAPFGALAVTPGGSVVSPSVIADGAVLATWGAPQRRAIIVVDCQNDFCEGGSLAVTGGAAAVARIADYLLSAAAQDAVIVATRDHHVDPGPHFAEHPDFIETWPPHCVAGTRGAEPHANLTPALSRIGAWFHKGQHAAAYSGFEGVDPLTGRSLEDHLRAEYVGKVDVVGIATDYCVAATVRSAVAAGYEVRLLSAMCAAVDNEHGEQMISEFAAAGVTIDPLTGA